MEGQALKCHTSTDIRYLGFNEFQENGPVYGIGEQRKRANVSLPIQRRRWAVWFMLRHYAGVYLDQEVGPVVVAKWGTLYTQLHWLRHCGSGNSKNYIFGRRDYGQFYGIYKKILEGINNHLTKAGIRIEIRAENPQTGSRGMPTNHSIKKSWCQVTDLWRWL
jgi:hypothetical protein